MSGTNPVAQYGKLDYTTAADASAYKAGIDANSVVASRVVQPFAPHQSSPAAMTVTLDAGFVFVDGTLTEIAAQTTGVIVAPVGNDRIDRVVVDRVSGAASVITGVESATPTPPAIPTGTMPIAQILLHTSTTAIGNSQLTDERAIFGVGLKKLAYTASGADLQDSTLPTSKAANTTGTGTKFALGTNPVFVGVVKDGLGDLRALPGTTQAAAYTLVAGDAGTRVDAGGNVTVPSGVFAKDQVICIHNNTAGNLSIIQGTGVTLIWSGQGTTGNRTITTHALCSLVCVAADTFLVLGAGVQ